jgi:hypothetical protein
MGAKLSFGSASITAKTSKQFNLVGKTIQFSWKTACSISGKA